MEKETKIELLILILIVSIITYTGFNMSSLRSGRYHKGNEQIISSSQNATFIENLPDKFTFNQVAKTQNCISFTLQENTDLSYEYPYKCFSTKNPIKQIIFDFFKFDTKLDLINGILLPGGEKQVRKLKFSYEKIESTPDIQIKRDWYKIEIINNQTDVPYGVNFVLNKPLIVRKEKINLNHIKFYLLQVDNYDSMSGCQVPGRNWCLKTSDRVENVMLAP